MTGDESLTTEHAIAELFVSRVTLGIADEGAFVRDALDFGHPRRLGHGIRAFED